MTSIQCSYQVELNEYGAFQKRRPQVQMRAIFVVLILKFQLVISAERTSTFQPERAGVNKIYIEDLWKYILVLNWIHKLEYLSAYVCLCLTPILQNKKQTDDQNQNILVFFWNQWYFGLSCEVMNATLSLKLSMLCYALMNSIAPYSNQVLPLLE